MLLNTPGTAPLNYTFRRALDTSTGCHLCRNNFALDPILLATFPVTYIQRAPSISTEESATRLDTPIFECSLVFPGDATAVHFFEPRYRLMLRRCLAQPVPSFGMIMPARPRADAAYGTMLEIRSVHTLPDGRCIVETWSTYPFRILERDTLDGYTVARIERIDDIPDLHEVPAGDPSDAALRALCIGFVDQLRRGAAPWVVKRLRAAHGPPPAAPGAFAYWVARALPVDDAEKSRLLPIRSARLRLRLVAHWITELNQSWWFGSGCVVQ
ncbi:PUA-like domain-containing protein [Mycena crocata]|nr:PUA-like domain-containing protein [Mycena crocata]